MKSTVVVSLIVLMVLGIGLSWLGFDPTFDVPIYVWFGAAVLIILDYKIASLESQLTDIREDLEEQVESLADDVRRLRRELEGRDA